MNIKMIRAAVSIAIIISMVVHPCAYSHSQALPDDLSPCPVSASVPMTDGDSKFAESVIRDAQFLSFAIFAYKTVVTEGSDAGAFFARLTELPFWGEFRFKAYLAKEFISVKGDILTVKLKAKGVIRIAPSSTHKPAADGALEDGIVPEAFYATEGYLVQYVANAVPAPRPEPDKKDSGDTGEPRNMIGFGPELSYRALKIADDFKGIYIAVAEEKLERSKISINVHELTDLTGRVTAKLRENGLFTAAQVIAAGDEKLAGIFGPMTAERILAACAVPRYTDRLSFVCRTEEGSGSRAQQIAEMLNQALFIINGNKDISSRDPLESSLADVLKDMAGRMRGRKIKVEAAANLEANSTYYPGKIVFNKGFIDFLYDRWVSHRVERTSEHWTEEIGALVMLSERLFHEMDHDTDEVRQILLDRLYYKATLNGRNQLKDAVRYDVSFNVKPNGSGSGSPLFGEVFGTNAYFAMIHRISEMNDLKEMTRVILEYLENAYRSLSRRDALNLTDAQISFAAKLLREHGVTDDLFGEAISGKCFDAFFKDHCLFSAGHPYNHDEIDVDQRRRSSEIYRRNVEDIKNIALNVARSIGKEDETRRWIENSLKASHITGFGSTKKKLYPIIKWVAAVLEPQNFQIRKGKLFGRTYYRGLNLMTLPIFPVGDDGEVKWELFRFNEEYSVWDASKRKNVIVRAPPKAYYEARKISLYEYVITHAPAAGASGSEQASRSGKTAPVQPTLFDVEDRPGPDKKGTPKKKTRRMPVRKPKGEHLQQTLFSVDGPDYEDSATGNDLSPVTGSGEYADSVRRSISELHAYTTQVDVSPTIAKVTHILIAKDIPADSQQDILTFLNKRSRDSLVAEKVYFMNTEDIDAYLAANRCGRDNTVVLLPDPAFVEKIKGDVNMLVIRKEGVTDFVNIEGLIGAARCVLNRDWDSFRGIYRSLTGAECPQIRPEWLANPAELARHLIITLPPVSIIKVEEQKMLNEMLREALVAA